MLRLMFLRKAWQSGGSVVLVGLMHSEAFVARLDTRILYCTNIYSYCKTLFCYFSYETLSNSRISIVLSPAISTSTRLRCYQIYIMPSSQTTQPSQDQSTPHG